MSSWAFTFKPQTLVGAGLDFLKKNVFPARSFFFERYLFFYNQNYRYKKLLIFSIVFSFFQYTSF